jgi:glycosyltransferase involved in cell wall biosynthesis
MALRNAGPAYRAALDDLLRSQSFDIVHAASIEMAGYGLQARHSGAALVIDEFNAEYVLQRRAALNDLRRGYQPRALLGGGYSLLQWLKLAAYERQLLAAGDALIAVSEEDRRALRRLSSAGRIAIVPNGVDCTYFQPQSADTGATCDLVFTGTLDFRPNIDAVLWFAHEVLPLVRTARPDVRFVVVGRNPAPVVRALHDGRSIAVLGEVPDVRPAIAAAAAYVVPMRIGGGVRLKLLEALAMQAPTVSTCMGAQGVAGLEQSQHLLLADQPPTFARALLSLLDQPAWARCLGSQGRALVQARYDWQVIVPRLEQVYAEVMR